MFLGLVSIIQILNLFQVQDIMANYYGKLNSESRIEYLQFNPRASGTFNFEPNTFGLYMAISLIMYHVFGANLLKNKILFYMVYFFGMLGLILSGSFTGFLVYVIVTFIYFIVYKKINFKMIVLAFVSIAIFALFFSVEIERSFKRQKLSGTNLIPSSLIHRFDTRWTMVFRDFEKSPYIGIGPSAIQMEYSADNEYLDKFLRHGLLGGLAFFFFTVFLILYPLLLRSRVNISMLRKMFFFSFLLALSFGLASFTGTAFKAKRLAELFWIFYSLPFIRYYLHKKYFCIRLNARDKI
jgi:hypothetical protein